MMHIQSKKPGRQGFTMVELLVVIAIIAVLMGLTLSAVMKVFIKGPEAVTRSEITGLANAIGAFQQDFPNAKYIPSKFILKSDLTTYNTATPGLEKDSITYLQQMFGKRIGLNATTGAKILIQWNGSVLTNPVTLTGDQCLVFFLGGIPTQGTAGCLGFSTDPTDPSSGTTTRLGPYYEFKTSRLKLGNGNFYSYIDGFNQGAPYAYFSSYKVTSGYNRYGPPDCNGWSFTNITPPAPYQLPSGGPFINPNSFQIISAGANAVFGPGGTTWNPNSGYTPANAGADDFSNFSSLKLGSPQQ